MKTEAPPAWTTNFIGLEQLIEIGGRSCLRVSVEGEAWELSPPIGKLQCPSEVVEDLGIELLLPATPGELEVAVEAAELDARKVGVLLVGEDGFLKEREILFQCLLLELDEGGRIFEEGERRPRAITNSRTGFSLELSFVLTEELEPAFGRPHRLGTKLFSTVFEFKPYSSPDGLNPVELSKEVIQKHHLSSKTQLFVEFKEELLTSEDLSDALTIHVDSKLLKGIKARKMGLEFEYLTANLAINALQQVVFELSRELGEAGGREAAEDLPPVLAMVVGKLQGVKRAGAKALTLEQAVTMIEHDPGEAAALLTGLLDMTPGSRKLIRDSYGSGKVSE